MSNENQEFYNKFISDWINIRKAGIEIDSSKGDNFFYEKNKGINFIDLTPMNRDVNIREILNSVLAVLFNIRFFNFKKEKDFENKENMKKILDKISLISKKIMKSFIKEGLNINEIKEVINKRLPILNLEYKSLLDLNER